MVDAPFAQDLLGNLEEARDLFEQLQELLLRERQHLLGLDVEAILDVTQQKEKLALRHRQLEDSRARLLEREGFAGASLDMVAKAIGGRKEASLRQCGDELRSLVDATRQMNELNSHLVRTSLASIARNVQRLSGAPKLGSSTYAHLGRRPRLARSLAAIGGQP
jgi:flagellar biosynthesis/type III secretory pathway chaperone